MSRWIVPAISSFVLSALMVASSAPAATLFLRNGDDDSESLILGAGGTGILEIALELEEGETLAFANVFLDGIVVGGDSGVVEILDFIPGLVNFVYERSAMPANFPYPEGEGITIDEYTLVMGQGDISGPGIVVLEQLIVHSLGDGAIDISFETGARQPMLTGPGPTFMQFTVAPTSLPPDEPLEGFVYLGTGDAREGGVGPFALNHGAPANDNIDEPADNENDNEAEPPPNDNAEPADNENDNVAANDNTSVQPEEPNVSINGNSAGDLLGVLDDGLTEVAIYVARDQDDNATTIIGLVIESDGALAKMVIGGNLLRNIEGDNGETVQIEYDFAANTATLIPSSGDEVVVSLFEETDLAAAAEAGAGAISGESPQDSMVRLLDELGSVMAAIMGAINDNGDAVALLDAVGGFTLVSYPFGVAADSAEMAINDDSVTETDFDDLGDSTIDDPLDDLAGLTENPTEEGAGSGTDGGGGGGGGSRAPGLCGIGMIGFAGLTVSALGVVRVRRGRRGT